MPMTRTSKFDMQQWVVRVCVCVKVSNRFETPTPVQSSDGANTLSTGYIQYETTSRRSCNAVSRFSGVFHGDYCYARESARGMMMTQ